MAIDLLTYEFLKRYVEGSQMGQYAKPKGAWKLYDSGQIAVVYSTGDYVTHNNTVYIVPFALDATIQTFSGDGNPEPGTDETKWQKINKVDAFDDYIQTNNSLVLMKKLQYRIYEKAGQEDNTGWYIDGEKVGQRDKISVHNLYNYEELYYEINSAGKHESAPGASVINKALVLTGNYYIFAFTRDESKQTPLIRFYTNSPLRDIPKISDWDIFSTGGGGIENILNLENGENTNAIQQKLNNAKGSHSFAEGKGTTAEGDNSHAEGRSSKTSGYASHAEGYETEASGDESHSEGRGTKAMGQYSHAEGRETEAGSPEDAGKGRAAHAEGGGTHATGANSHAEGNSTWATHDDTHAEGYMTQATGSQSHAEGYQTQATKMASHSEGMLTEANGDYSHAEGYDTTAGAYTAHAEGWETQANGYASHAEGGRTQASGAYSHVSGFANISNTDYQTVIGKANAVEASKAFIIGNGPIENDYSVTYSKRKNAMTVDWNGNMELAGGIILKDTSNNKKYKLTITNGSLQINEYNG